MTNDLRQLRILSVTFDSHLEPWELPKFRGAMAHKVGLEHEWFHNHRAEPAHPEYHYRYPLIQYKLHQNCPMLLCIDEGVEEAQHFFTQPDWSMTIGGKKHNMRIKDLNVKQYEMRLSEQKKEYRLHNWLALNQENYQPYKDLERLSAKLEFLEPLLVGQILAFARGIGWDIPNTIEVCITDLLNTQYISYKDVKHLAFNLHFKTNVFLPNFIGLGKGTTHGFGVIKQNR